MVPARNRFGGHLRSRKEPWRKKLARVVSPRENVSGGTREFLTQQKNKKVPGFLVLSKNTGA